MKLTTLLVGLAVCLLLVCAHNEAKSIVKRSWWTAIKKKASKAVETVAKVGKSRLNTVKVLGKTVSDETKALVDNTVNTATEIGDIVVGGTKEIAKEGGKVLENGFQQLEDLGDEFDTTDLIIGLGNTIMNGHKLGMATVTRELRRIMVKVFERYTDMLLENAKPAMMLMGVEDDAIEDFKPVIKEAAKAGTCHFVCNKVTDALFQASFVKNMATLAAKNKSLLELTGGNVVKDSATEACKPFCNHAIEELMNEPINDD